MRMWCVALTVAAVLSAQPISAQEPATDVPFALSGETFVAVRVPDVEAAEIWYARVFGLSTVNRIDEPNGRYRIRILDRPGLSVELLQHRDDVDPPAAHTGLFKVGFYVDDVEAAHAWMHTRGVDSDAQTFFDEALQARSFLIRDPWGNRIQIFERERD